MAAETESRMSGDLGGEVCLVPDCERPADVRGICKSCYDLQRLRKSLRAGEIRKLMLPAKKPGRRPGSRRKGPAVPARRDDKVRQASEPDGTPDLPADGLDLPGRIDRAQEFRAAANDRIVAAVFRVADVLHLKHQAHPRGQLFVNERNGKAVIVSPDGYIIPVAMRCGRAVDISMG